MKLELCRNGTGKKEEVLLHTGVSLVAIIGEYLAGKFTHVDGSGPGMLRLLRGLEPDTTRCLSSIVLSLLHADKERINGIFGEYGFHAAVAVVELSRYAGERMRLVGSTSIQEAARAHRDLGQSALEAALAKNNFGASLYHSAQQFAEQEISS